MAATSKVYWCTRRVGAQASVAAPHFNPADFSPAIRTRLLILQPTPFCNVDCDYCYLPGRDSTARMDIATVRRAAERLRDDGLLGDELTVVWHAGEPLTMPMAFYDDAVAAVHEALGGNCAVSHAVQTNATLIDDAWCALFARHGMHIGVSVDGPRALHDAHRRTRDGRGTHDRALRGMARLREAAIPFHAIAVVTTATFAHADAFYDFFVQQGVTQVGCNFDEAEGLHAQSSVDGHEAAHAAFVERLLERSVGDGRLRVRELTLALEQIRTRAPQRKWRGHDWPDNAQTVPFALLTVAHDGGFCTFSPELLGQSMPGFGDFVLGNVAEAGYLAAAETERFGRLWGAVVRGTQRCERDCAHFGFCGGGAPANKLYENGDFDSGETLYCRTMVKRPFDAVLRRLECEAAVARAGQASARLSRRLPHEMST